MLGPRLGRLGGAPAAVLGMVTPAYTGALLSATSVPIRSVPYRVFPPLFRASATATAAAALELFLEAAGAPPSTHAAVERVGIAARGAELALALAAERAWRRAGVGGPLEMGPLALPLPPGRPRRRNRGAARHPPDPGRDGSSVADPLADRGRGHASGFLRRAVLLFARNEAAPARGRLRPQPAHGADRMTPAEACREAIEMLHRALAEPPAHLSDDVDRAERAAAVRPYDELIERLRQGDGPRSALDRVNAALSLVDGVEHPPAGVHRRWLEDAKAALRDLSDEGLR